jgi:hypothetical protein
MFNVSPAAMSVRLQQLGLVESRGQWRRDRSERAYFRDAPASPLVMPMAA